MTPTAEQIEREKGRAHEVAVAYYDAPTSSFAALVDIVATALAARATEVREESLNEARCLNCGGEVIRWRARFCSSACRREWRNTCG